MCVWLFVVHHGQNMLSCWLPLVSTQPVQQHCYISTHYMPTVESCSATYFTCNLITDQIMCLEIVLELDLAWDRLSQAQYVGLTFPGTGSLRSLISSRIQSKYRLIIISVYCYGAILRLNICTCIHTCTNIYTYVYCTSPLLIHRQIM